MTRPGVEGLGSLSDERLSVLLSLAVSGRGMAWLPTPSATIERARAALASLTETGGGRPSEWLGEIAEGSTTLARLVAIKRAAKDLVRTAAEEQMRTGAILVYHAAVAAAFARYATVISSRPLGLRLGLYDGLAAALGDHPAGHVFRSAVERYLVP